MNQHTDSTKPTTHSAMKPADAGKQPSLKIITIGEREGIVVEGSAPTATIAIVPAELVWIGRNATGEITEIAWDPDAAVFQPRDFETLRSKSPFLAFAILTRDGGLSTFVRSASDLYVGQEAIVVKTCDRSMTTIPLRSIQAIEMLPVAQKSNREYAKVETDI